MTGLWRVGLAGSLITLISDLPVTAQTADDETGSVRHCVSQRIRLEQDECDWSQGGHVTIVVPRPTRVYAADMALAALASGASPSAIEP